MEGALSSVLLYSPESGIPKDFFDIFSKISVIIVISAVALFIYRFEFYRKNKINAVRIIALIISTFLYSFLAISRASNLTGPNPFFQFFIAIWVVINPVLFDNSKFITFKTLSSDFEEELHSCDPNAIDYKNDDGKSDKLPRWHTMVFLRKDNLIRRLNSPECKGLMTFNSSTMVIEQDTTKKKKWRIQLNNFKKDYLDDLETTVLEALKKYLYVWLGELGALYYRAQAVLAKENEIPKIILK